MSSEKQQSIALNAPADAVFQAALGVVQSRKRTTILAVHNTGHKLIVREKGMTTNPKFIQMWLEADAAHTQMHVTVSPDPRAPKALLDGKFNDKALKTFVEDVQGALDGSAPAPATPVPDHFVQKKAQVPWSDPQQDPAIELDGNFLAMYGR